MNVELLHGDCRQVLKTLPDESVHCCVTSPPYFGLRDYGVDGQIGLEQTPDAYVAELVAVFREVRRVLRNDGTLFLNLGDSYSGYHGNSKCPDADAPSNKAGYVENQRLSTANRNGLKPKDLIGIPWLVAFALRADGWYLRQDIIWHKPNPMPESVTDRCTKAHEYIFLLSKSERYYYDSEAVKEAATGWNGSDFHDGRNALNHPNVGKNRPSKKRGEFGGKTADQPGREAFRAVTESRNKRSVWTVNTRPYKEAHFATFPPALITPMILAGCPGKVCSKCGAPWERKTSKERKPTRPGLVSSKDATAPHQQSRGSGGNTELRYRFETKTTTLCFLPSCDCYADKLNKLSCETCKHAKRKDGNMAYWCGRPVGKQCACDYERNRSPASLDDCGQDGLMWEPEDSLSIAAGTVLDPFGGSGTTGEVSESLGRNSILIELNPAYIEIQGRRTAQMGMAV